MNKIFSALGTIVLVITGLFFASSAHKHKQNADRLTNAQVRKENSTKQSSLKKAVKLGDKAEKVMDKSREALKKSKQRQQELENRNETSLADRVRDFNDRL